VKDIKYCIVMVLIIIVIRQGLSNLVIVITW